MQIEILLALLTLFAAIAGILGDTIETGTAPFWKRVTITGWIIALIAVTAVVAQIMAIVAAGYNDDSKESAADIRKTTTDILITNAHQDIKTVAKDISIIKSNLTAKPQDTPKQ